MIYSNHKHSRLLQDGTIHLQRHEGHSFLGPIMPDVSKRFMIRVIVMETLLFLVFGAAMIISSILLSPDTGFPYTIGVLILFLAAQGIAMPVVTIIPFWRKVSQKMRLILLEDGSITVQNERHEDVKLRADEPIEFLCITDTDRDGREMFDVLLQNGREQYYLLSGRDRDDMERLRDDLENLLHSPASH